MVEKKERALAFEEGELVMVSREDMKTSPHYGALGIVVGHDFDNDHWFVRVKHITDGEVYGWFPASLRRPEDE
jgi:hypothetical protein